MAELVVTTAKLEAGGGGFKLPKLTLGVFLNDQRTHRFALGVDKRQQIPLLKRQGWLLAAGSEGICEYDQNLDVMMVEFDHDLLREVGLDSPEKIAHQVGSFDPLTLEFALGAKSYLSGTTMYRETMSRAFASHVVQSLQPQPITEMAIDDRRLRRAVDYIHDHLGSDLSLETLAGEAAMSPFHFSRAFKSATGSSPLQYVIRARIDLAKILLKTTSLSVAEVAYRVGFEDAGTLSRHFKKRLGVTPAAFRSG